MNAANDSLRVNGVGRDASDPRTLVIYFNEKPNDDDLRRIHDLLRDGAGLPEPSARASYARDITPTEDVDNLARMAWFVGRMSEPDDHTYMPSPGMLEVIGRLNEVLASPVAPVGAPTARCTAVRCTCKPSQMLTCDRMVSQGCELATDATKQLREPSVHLAMSTSSVPTAAPLLSSRETARSELPHMPKENKVILALRNDYCGTNSNSNLWYGSSLEEAGEAWRKISRDGDEEVWLIGGGWTLASHEEMRWRFGPPRGTFACPICGKETPHEHSAEAVELQRHSDAVTVREMEKRWQEIEARVASLKDNTV